MLELCRICLFVINESNSISIFFKVQDNKSILDIIKECSSIQVLEQDVLPQFICTECVEKLNIYFEFRKLIINSDNQLKQSLKSDENFFTTESSDKPEYPQDEEKVFENADIKDELKDIKDSVTELPLPLPKSDETESSKLISDNSASGTNQSPGHENEVKSDPAEFVNIIEQLNETKCTEETIKKRKRKVYECEECNVKFTTIYSYKKHNMEHTGIKPFSCEFCGKGFSMNWPLTIHRRTHTGDKPLTCEVCNKKFGSPPSLVVHKRIHTGVKNYHCAVCKKSYFQQGQLEVHMRIHTGEKPFMCEICSKTFIDRGGLQKHRERHDGVPDLQCPICGKTYKGQSCLHEHIKRHSGIKRYNCEECGQKFTNQSTLKRHILIHSGIKPYKCTVCSKSFTQSNVLVKHMRIHSGEKPFACSLCTSEFAYKHHLQGHVKRHHKDSFDFPAVKVDHDQASVEDSKRIYRSFSKSNNDQNSYACDVPGVVN